MTAATAALWSTPYTISMQDHAADRADPGWQRNRSPERADDVRHQHDRERGRRMRADREERAPQDEDVEAEVADGSQHRPETVAVGQQALGVLDGVSERLDRARPLRMRLAHALRVAGAAARLS